MSSKINSHEYRQTDGSYQENEVDCRADAGCQAVKLRGGVAVQLDLVGDQAAFDPPFQDCGVYLLKLGVDAFRPGVAKGGNAI